MNKVEVSYTRIDGAEKKTITETYQIYTGPTYANVNGMARFPQPFFDAKVKKVDPEFADRLYLINNFQGKSSKGTRVSWNNPEGGALEWNFEPQVAVIDTTVKSDGLWMPLLSTTSIPFGMQVASWGSARMMMGKLALDTVNATQRLI